MRERRSLRLLLIGTAMAVLFSAGPAFEAPAATADAERSASYYQDALKQLEEGDPAAAIIQLRNALQQNPDNLDARLLLGRLYLAAGDGASAEKELRRVWSVRPADETEILLGNALLMQQKFDQVLSEISREASSPDRRREKLLLHGNAQSGLGRGEEAEATYREILQSDPASVSANLALARLKAAQSQFDAASVYLETALEANPELLEGWLLKADIATRRRDFGAAEAALEQAERIRPGDLRIRLNRAQMLLQTGRLDEGEAEVAAVLQQQPNHPFARYLQTGIHLARGNYEEADRLFLAIQDDLREFSPARLLGALIKFSIGQYAQAERMLTRYIAEQPANTTAKRLLALVHLRQGNPRSAVEILEPVVAEQPDDLAATQLLASGYMRLEQYDQAAKMFERISHSSNPNVVQQARTALALLGQSLGIDAPADGTSATTPATTPPADGAGDLMAADDLSKGILLVLDYLRTRDLDAALAEIQTLKESHPDNPVVLNIEGGVHLARGEEDLARQRFEEALAVNPDFLSALTNLDRLDLRAGNPEPVEQRMRDRLAADPTDPQMTLRLAQFLTHQDRADEAQELLESARSRMPENTAIRRALITSYLGEGARDPAVAVARELTQVAAAAEDADAVAFAGRALLQSGAAEDAVDAFEKLTALQPESDAARIALADSLFAADRKQEARSVLTSLREARPGNVAATTGLINFALSDGQPEEAVRLAEALDPHNPVAAAQLKADVLARTGRTDEAVAVLSDAFEEHPVSALALDLFLARRSAGQIDPAIAELEAWLAKEADDDTARNALASALIEKGRYEDAAEQYEILVRDNPNDPVVLNNLAWIKHEMGDPDAVDYARRARMLAPDSAEVADTLGWMLVQSDETSEEGLGLLREAATAAPANPDIQYHLAYALQAAGDRKAAEEILEKLLATNQPFTEREAAQLLLTELRG